MEAALPYNEGLDGVDTCIICMCIDGGVLEGGRSLHSGLSRLKTSEGIAASLKQQSLRHSRQHNAKVLRPVPSIKRYIYTADKARCY